MIALVHWIFRLFDKEHLLVLNYRKSHPHFFLYIAIDAVLSVTLVITGAHFFGPHIWASHENFMLEHPGVIPAPLDKLLDYVTREKESVYWLGGKRGERYTYKSDISGRDILSYYSGDAMVPSLRITTYKNPLVYEEYTSHFNSETAIKATLSNGRFVEYDPNSLKIQMVTFASSPAIVIIEYLGEQTIENLFKDAANLRLLN